MTIEDELNLSELNLDGSHAVAKKSGESVAYQGRPVPRIPTSYGFSGVGTRKQRPPIFCPLLMVRVTSSPPLVWSLAIIMTPLISKRTCRTPLDQ
jgi:hypothetical protein